MLTKEPDEDTRSRGIVLLSSDLVVEMTNTLSPVSLPQLSERHRAGRLDRLTLQEVGEELPAKPFGHVTVIGVEARAVVAVSWDPHLAVQHPIPSLFKEPDPAAAFSERAGPPSIHLVPPVTTDAARSHERLLSVG